MLARLSAWKEVIDTANLSADRPMDAVSKWLIITRAAVFSMTVTSGLIGAMLAIGTDPGAVHYGYLALAVLGLVVAHAANNIINDYFDLDAGIDSAGYVRAQYAPHPILSGMVTRAQLRNAILLLGERNARLLNAALMVAWPLWFVGASFIHTRRAGALLVAGLFLNAVLPGFGLDVTVPWLGP